MTARDALLVQVNDLIERALIANERADSPLAADALASGLAVSIVALLPSSAEDAVQVPADGWKQGDWFVDENGSATYHWATIDGSRSGWKIDYNRAVSEEDVAWWLESAVYIHAPREGGTR